MNIDELYLNIHNSSFDSLIRQADIQTEADVQAYHEKGYFVQLTESEFQERFPGIETKHICYIPSFSLSCFYFNRDTLVVCPFRVDMLLLGTKVVTLEGTCREIERREKMAAAGDYAESVFTLPDRMKLEYFTMLVEKHGATLPNLYRLFFDMYTESDYGFNGLDTHTLETILNSKTESDKARTATAVKNLPETITVYRGGNTESADYAEAWSWTLDINTANFFASRRGRGPGYIVEAQVNNADIIDAFLDNRDEQEIIVAPADVRFVREIPIHGLDFLKDALPKVTPLYRQYRDELDYLDFAMDSQYHGKAHEARVLLLTQIISELLDLPLLERKILAEAAIYHDTQRTNDDEDACHGAASAEYYHDDVAKPSFLVEFLCQYHCLPDEQGYTEIRNNKKLSRNRSQATRLYQVFKDADALDRIRLGSIRELDLNQLRLDVSKELTLVARFCLEQIKV